MAFKPTISPKLDYFESSPLTTKGDVFTYSTVEARLPVGSNGQLLQADSGETTGLKWATIAGAGDVTAAANLGDNLLIRGDGAAKGVQNSGITIDDTNNMTGMGTGHDIFTDFVANEHVDHTAVTLTAGDGLSGGGDISANRTFTVNVDDATIETNTDTLRVKADGINDTHIDWGTGASQVSAVDVPIADAGNFYTGTEVETGMQEIGATRRSGIFNHSLLDISYDPATRQFTVVNSGTDVAVNGIVSTPDDETTAAHADTTEQYWAYYESGATTLTISTTVSITASAIAGRVYYNTDQGTAKAVEFEERHSQQFSSILHSNQHTTVGAKFVTAPLGCTMADYVLKSKVDADMQFSLTDGAMYDEDIEHVITALSAGGYTIAYRAGLDTADRLDWDDSATLPYLNGTYIYYNQNNGGTWQNTELTNKKFVNYYVFGWTRADDTRDIVIFMGQTLHDKKGDAEAESVGDLDLPSQLAPEQVPLYKITFKAEDGAGSTGKCKIAVLTDFRGNVS